MTVLEVIQRSAEFLDRRGVESPRLQVEWIVAHAVRLPRLQLYLNFERVLAPAELDWIRAAVQRRGAREPLQHILGTAVFCGLELACDRRALVPRPETELLAELAWTRLNQFAAATLRPRALDFGTGSGCLAITLAVHGPGAHITALDASADALALARTNAARHGVAERIEFRAGAGLAALPAGARFDLIVANPPYIPTGELAGLEPEVREFDPRLALDGGADGLDCFRELARDAKQLLVAGGGVFLAEFGDGQAEALRALFGAEGWRVEAIESDDTRRPRFLIARPGQP